MTNKMRSTVTPKRAFDEWKSNEILPCDLEETSTPGLIDVLNPATYKIACGDGIYHRYTNPEKPITYVLAANGLFKMSSGRHLYARIPVARWKRLLPGLREANSCVRFLTIDRIPADLLDICLEHARRASWARPVETMYQFYVRGVRIHVTRPEQLGSAGGVVYAADKIDPVDVILDLHTHPTFHATFSEIDNRDEGGLRLYAVLGRIYAPQPELAVRVGVYGDYMRLPAASVFAGINAPLAGDRPAATGQQAYRDTYRAD